MGTFGRITGLALLVGGHVILPFYINIKLIERGFSLPLRILIFLLLFALGLWNVVREVRKIIQEERRKK
ncbi:MAG TPA: hypothetical protein PK364_00940 [Synergistaceae bacterium]|nr:hypothetical protein [Synergistaceae bacterium]HPJ25322.1 hypothetical protein [Synergistaceae bacterium]HPQ36372.1 hypothetical protein [Synergistaceae bacterium]